MVGVVVVVVMVVYGCGGGCHDNGMWWWWWQSCFASYLYNTSIKYNTKINMASLQRTFQNETPIQRKKDCVMNVRSCVEKSKGSDTD